MKVIKTAGGNQIKMSKSEWQSIGKKAGWTQENFDDNIKVELDEYKKPTYPTSDSILSEYSLSYIKWAIKSLGEESIAGFSGVREEDVEEILQMATRH